MIVAVDGPAASGKGTLARRLADKFGLAYLETGALYRAVALKLLREGRDPADEVSAVRAVAALDTGDLSDPALRDEATGRAASVVAALPAVRQALLDFQRNFATTPPDGAAGSVLDGRDIGTVVCPQADVKLFVTASVDERARRRHAELAGRGQAPEFDAVRADLLERDARDAERSVAPLKPADDADLLDTTDLDIEAAFEAACAIVARRRV